MSDWTTDTAKVSALIVFAAVAVLALIGKGFGGISASLD
jgi:hypothetical protein